LKCFRMHQFDIDRLQEASIALGLYQTNIVERALQQYFMRIDNESEENTVFMPDRNTL